MQSFVKSISFVTKIGFPIVNFNTHLFVCLKSDFLTDFHIPAQLNYTCKYLLMEFLSNQTFIIKPDFLPIDFKRNQTQNLPSYLLQVS